MGNRGCHAVNAALTTVEGERGAHQRDWEQFTRLLVRYAEGCGTLIDGDRHYVKIGGHPCPPAAVNFFGGNYFYCTNEFFRRIRWTLRRREGATRPQQDCNLG